MPDAAIPVTIGPEEFASAALHLMEQRKITAVVVVDDERPRRSASCICTICGRWSCFSRSLTTCFGLSFRAKRDFAPRTMSRGEESLLC